MSTLTGVFCRVQGFSAGLFSEEVGMYFFKGYEALVKTNPYTEKFFQDSVTKVLKFGK